VKVVKCREFQTLISAKDKKIALVVSRWNSNITEKLLAGAQEAILDCGGSLDETLQVKVPGSFELPLACQKLAVSGNFDAVVALGALIDGETDHYHWVAESLVSGLSRVMLDTGVPIAFGVITAKTMEHALARAGNKQSNKGWEATVAAIEMASFKTPENS